MIPKKIHYCWFGKQDIPERDLKCIESWRKFFPDYEIIRWDETNFKVDICSYTKEAYDSKKWAFVSDFVRMYVLYEYGGLYFDTDVEVIKDFDQLITIGPFMGIEQFSPKCMVNPGIGMAAYPKMTIFKEILDSYYQSHFIDENGLMSNYTIVSRVSDILAEHGLKNKNEVQIVSGLYIYPKEFFCPLDYDTNQLNITNNSYTIHWYRASWFDERMNVRRNRCIKIRKLFNKNIADKICNIYLKVSIGYEYISTGKIKILIRKIINKIRSN